MSTDKPTSFESFVEHRHATNREVAVYVEADYSTDPPRGDAVAMRTAQELTDEDEEILRIDPESAMDDDVPENTGVVVITLPADPSDDEWRTVMRRLLSRVPGEVDIVVLVDREEVPHFCEELADVRVVVVGGGDPAGVYRVKLHPFSGEVYYREFEDDILDVEEVDAP